MRLVSALLLGFVRKISKHVHENGVAAGFVDMKRQNNEPGANGRRGISAKLQAPAIGLWFVIWVTAVWPGVSSAQVPACTGDIPSSYSYIYNGLGGQVEPYAFISSEPGAINNDQTCVPAADTTKLALLFGGSNVDIGSSYQVRRYQGIPAYEWISTTQGQGALVTIGSGSLTCTGLDGTASAQIPSDMQLVGGLVFVAAVPCRPRADGTVTIGLHVGNGSIYANRAGHMATSATWVGSNIFGSSMAGTGLGMLGTDAQLQAAISAGGGWRPSRGLPVWTQGVAVSSIGGGIGPLESCTIDAPGTIDWGIIDPTELQVAPTDPLGKEVADTKTVTVTTTCSGLVNAQVNNGWAVTGAIGTLAGYHVPKGWGLGVSLIIKGPGGDKCNPLRDTCNRVSVNTAGETQRQIKTGTSASRTMELLITPWKLPQGYGDQIAFGRLTTTLNLNYYYPH